MDYGTVLTTVIGASAATIGVAVTKDAKISEFRQQWIDELRKDIAELCAISVALFHGNVQYMLGDRFQSKKIDTAVLTQAVNRVNYRIRLRLDPSKPRSYDLLNAMNELVKLTTYAEQSFDSLSKAVDEVLEKTVPVLDDAWKAVRRGEFRFRWSFRIAVTVLIASLLWLIVPAVFRMITR